MDYTKKLNYPLILLGVTDDGLNKLSELFPEQFDYFFDRDDSDYIYETEEYISIKGNKNRGKRNHLNRFRKSGSVYSTITEKDFDDCIRFCESEFEKRESDANSSLIVEQHAIKKYFENFHELGLKGGMHRIDNQIVALSLGEPLNSETFVIHIEKANTQFHGAYVGIRIDFAKNEALNYKYINFEEDMGLDGLRKSKLQSFPKFILNKYIVTFK